MPFTTFALKCLRFDELVGHKSRRSRSRCGDVASTCDTTRMLRAKPLAESERREQLQTQQARNGLAMSVASGLASASQSATYAEPQVCVRALVRRAEEGPGEVAPFARPQSEGNVSAGIDTQLERQCARRRAIQELQHLDVDISASRATPTEKALMQQRLRHLWALADAAMGVTHSSTLALKAGDVLDR